MKNPMRWIVLALIIGGLLGAASSLVLIEFFHPGGMHEMHFGRARKHFFHSLQLTGEQQAQVDAIVRENRQKLDTVFSETEPRVEAIRAATSAQIRQILTPDQQLRFDRIAARRQAEHQERRERRRQHGPPLL